MNSKTRLIKTVAVIGALVMIILTAFPGCNFIGKTKKNGAGEVLADEQGNMLCCPNPDCGSIDIAGPDADNNYTCNACGFKWSYTDDHSAVDNVIDAQGNTVDNVDPNAGFVSGGGSDSGSGSNSGSYNGGSGSGNGSGNSSGNYSGNGSGSGSGNNSGNGSGNKTPGNNSGNNSGNGNKNPGTNTGSSTSILENLQKLSQATKDFDGSIEIVYDEATNSYTAKSKDGTDTGLFGYKYSLTDKIFYTAEDSWQRNFGFNEVYDKAAAIGFMTYNTYRVYFTYDNLEWMIQFWKGQYGYAFVGSEIGVYTRPLGSDNGTHYECADDAHKFYMTMDVYRQNPQNPNKYDHLFTRSRSKTWWCTGFVPGTLGFAQANVPDENGTAKLKVDSKIEFYNAEMAHAFMNGLSKVKYLENNAALSGTNRTVNFIQYGSEEEYAKSSASCKYALCADGSSVRVCYR